MWQNGQQFENTVLGRYFWNKRIRHTKYWAGFVYVVKNHPKQAGTEFTHKFTAMLAQELGVQKKEVFFYSAVGTSLDQFHGIDAFIIVKIDGKSKVATIDTTLKAYKNRCNADFIVRPGDISNPRHLARAVARHLLNGAKYLKWYQ